MLRTYGLTEERFSDNDEQDKQNENGTCICKSSSETAATITASCFFNNSRHWSFPFQVVLGTPLRTSYIMYRGGRLIGPLPGTASKSSFWASAPAQTAIRFQSEHKTPLCIERYSSGYRGVFIFVRKRKLVRFLTSLFR